MIRLHREPGVFTIENVPAGYWVGAAVFLVLFIVILVGSIPPLPEETSERLRLTAILAALLAASVFFAKAPIRKTNVNRNLQKVMVSSRGLFGKQFEEYSFDEIDGGAIVHKKEDNDGKMHYSIKLLLRNTKVVELSMPNDHDVGLTCEAVDTINEYLGMSLDKGDFVPRVLELD